MIFRNRRGCDGSQSAVRIKGVPQEGTELVRYRRYAVGTGLVVEVWKLMLPEGTYLRVSHSLGQLPPVSLEDEEFHDVPQVSGWLFQKGQDSVAQQMLHPRTPGIRPLLLQGFNQSRGDEGSYAGETVTSGLYPNWHAGSAPSQ